VNRSSCQDVSRFLLGESPTTGRESYMFFGVDGQLMSVKWRYYKMVVRTTQAPGMEALNSGFEAPQVPMFFDLSSDPHENFNLWSATLTMGWLGLPMGEITKAYDKSVEEYPNIKPGEHFTGYRK
jgi:hypothetical protein